MAAEEVVDWPDRWADITKLLATPGPLCHPDFEPGPSNLENLRAVKVLVVGAGGLGCELLKDLALSGFRNIHVIDMDTIDVSNLNRQFLFRIGDVGDSKAEVAAAFINNRIPGAVVTPHFCKIETKESEFYRSFNLVICGLDSVVARRWINSMLVSLLEYSDDGDLNTGTVIPLIDGGTEGFLGNVRVVLPGLTPCIECTIGLFPPQVNFPLCTIAHTPRLPEHCVEFVRMIQWEKEAPFEGADLDADDPKHVDWVLKQATERATEYGIRGVNLRLVQGVLKRIIPAVASTNAVVAAACALEAFKFASSCSLPLNNYMNFQDADGVSLNVVQLDKREDCPICSQTKLKLEFSEDTKLKSVLDYLINDPNLQMKSPSVSVAHPRFQTLYMSSVPSLEEKTHQNLKKTLGDLGLREGQELYVADQTTPSTLTFRLHLSSPMDQDL